MKLNTPKRTAEVDLEELESKVACDVEELVDSPMGAAGEASSSSCGAVASLDEWSIEQVDNGVVSAEKAEGLMTGQRSIQRVGQM